MFKNFSIDEYRKIRILESKRWNWSDFRLRESGYLILGSEAYVFAAKFMFEISCLDLFFTGCSHEVEISFAMKNDILAPDSA